MSYYRGKHLPTEEELRAELGDRYRGICTSCINTRGENGICPCDGCVNHSKYIPHPRLANQKGNEKPILP